MNKKKLYNVTETGQLLDIGRNKVYSLIKRDYLHALDIAWRRMRRKANMLGN